MSKLSKVDNTIREYNPIDVAAIRNRVFTKTEERDYESRLPGPKSDGSQRLRFVATYTMLEIQLLGAVQVTVNGENVKWQSRKAPALLAYLAVTKQEQRREFLADLLWSDTSPGLSLSNLRTILTMLRKAVGDYVIITRKTVALNPEMAIVVDVDAVPERAQQSEIARLKETLLGIKGDFLEGFTLTNAVRFDEWALLERERQRQRLIDAHRVLCRRLRERGRFDESAEIATLWQQRDPLSEAAWHELIWLQAASDRHETALASYEACRQLLADELGVTLNRQIETLVETIRAGQFELPSSKQAAHNLPAQFTPFVGRSAEIQHLTTTLSRSDCRLLTLHGVGGIGKTRLAIAVGEKLLHDFSRWRVVCLAGSD